MNLDPVYNPDTRSWDVYLGTWRIARGLNLLAAMRVAGYHVAEA